MQSSVHELTLQTFFVMSLDFAEIKNIENMSVGTIYRMH